LTTGLTSNNLPRDTNGEYSKEKSTCLIRSSGSEHKTRSQLQLSMSSEFSLDLKFREILNSVSFTVEWKYQYNNYFIPGWDNPGTACISW